MSLQNYEMNDILLVIVGVASALSGLCLAIQKSKCKDISVCFGMFSCSRDTKAIIEEERLEKTGHTGSTPRPPATLSQDNINNNSCNEEEELFNR